MTLITRDRLYNLLPAIYRLRDGVEGEPLRALLAVVEQELQILEGNISDLYDDWFIETCAEWVVPYIGDLLDVRELYADRDLTYGQQERRAYIANTLAYRRRKGTAPILEQLTRDVTGWRSRVVEFARLVNTTQNLDHLRPHSTTVNLRTQNQSPPSSSPFATQAAYSVEVRPISRGGRYNTPNIGLYIWRLQSYPLERSTARRVLLASDRAYTFNCLGQDQPLFNQPQTETNIVSLAEEINLPVRLHREPLAQELANRRQARSQGQAPRGLGYFDSDPVLQLWINRQPQPVPPEEIVIYKLEPWPTPEEIRSSALPNDADLPAPTVAVDPELGRIWWLGESAPQHVEVSYFYGFSDDVGGGTYGRAEAPDLTPSLSDADQTQIQIDPMSWVVQQEQTADPNPLATAIETWNQTVTAWEGFVRNTHIPLARISIPAVHLVQVDRAKVRQRFSPGVLGEGLSVVSGLCPTEVMITAGVAIDAQGRSLRLCQSQRFDLKQVDVAALPDGKGVLVIADHPSSPEAGKLKVIPEKTLEGYPTGTLIPLARLRLSAEHQLTQPPDQTIRLQLQPGIVQGLEVQTRPGTLETYVTAGTGVDRQGRVVVLPQNCPVDVRGYQGQTRSLVLGLPNCWGATWQIDLLAPQALKTLDYPVLHLADLEIPSVVIHQVDTDIYPQATWTRQGLAVSFSGAQITIAPGSLHPLATSPSQQPRPPVLTLEREQRLDLSAYAGRTLILWLAIAPSSGLPLHFVEPPRGQGWRNLGIVPDLNQIPGQPTVANGLIVIGDNQTYVGDLTIVLPPQRRLTIVAANGYRPHLQGAIAIQGTALAEERDRRQGELRLDGLLIEGQVQVTAGNLGQLALHHCTLVPQAGGLCVTAETPDQPACQDDSDLTLAAFFLYCLTLIGVLIRQELGISRSHPPLTLGEVLKRIVERLTLLFTEFVQKLQACFSGHGSSGQPGEPCPRDRQANSRLAISLYRTISGAIALPDTVPSLRLEDSVVDKGGLPEQFDTSGTAIAAPGAMAEILTTTVLGRTRVQQLEASNSLFTEKVTVLRHQEGCLRFCYVPEGSQTPRRYQCQPDRAFQEVLDQIPAAVSALCFQSAVVTTPALLLMGTSGEGVFRFGSIKPPATQPGSRVPGWIDATADLSNRYVTALLAYSRPLETGEANLDPQLNTVLVGTLSGQIFRGNLAPISEAGEPEPEISWQIPDWSPLPFTATNAAITTLRWVAVAAAGVEPIFLPSLWVATAGGGIWRSDLTGTNWQSVNAGLSNLNVTTLLWDAERQQLWAGTQGDGVFVLQPASQENGEETGDRWQPQNLGLSDRSITTLIQDPNGQILAGTMNGGIFALGEDKGWTALNEGLTSLKITALIAFSHSSSVASENNTDSSESHAEVVLMAGTADGQLFRSGNGGASWNAIELNLKGIDITALVVGSLTGNDTEISILAGTATGNVLRSDDGGQQWLSVQAGRPNLSQKLQIINRLQPNFTSTNYGDPGYVQLRRNCAPEICTGAEDGAELGVFNSLKQPQREANLRTSLDEYLRFGLSANIFYVT